MGVFNFLGGGKKSAPQEETQTQVVETHTVQPYNGIGMPPSGQPYNGIGTPPAPKVEENVAPVPQQPQDASSGEQNQNKENKENDTKKDVPADKPNEPSDKHAALDITTRLTQRSNRVLAASAQKAEALHSPFVDSEHVLFGLLTDQEIYNLLSGMKIVPQEVLRRLQEVMKDGNSKDKPQLAPRVKKILEDALIAARKQGYEFISPEHMLFALVSESEGMGAQILQKMGCDKGELSKKVLGKKLEEEQASQKQQSSLEKYAIDVTAKAAAGQLDPVVERAPVIERVIHVLSRRFKNNPVLIGEAGVGKTAVVEGFAQKIVRKEVPETLLNKRVFQLDLMGIIAGASKRGEFEERMKGLIDEVKNGKGEIILFIDEIHNIVGAGGASDGSSDAVNIIKPALARGEIQLIGATTTDEYKKHIEKDPALERRLQPIVVPEPTEVQAIKMLRAIRDKYEAFHKVKIPDEAIDSAVYLSKRYVGGRYLPDKAIDLIDESASAVRLPIISLPEEIASLEEQKKALAQEHQEALAKNNKVKASVFEKRITDIDDVLHTKQEEYAQKKAMSVGMVSTQLIKDVIARWTGIPVQKITESEKDKITKLEDIMHERLIGQESAVSTVAQAVRRGRAGLKSAGRPIGGFVFLGPTGVGKTELAKTLAEILFGTEDAMIRFDMTEYMEKHEVAKLLGAPPGYVGYEEGGKLTEAVKRKPYSVVLFDEIEKAHPDIFNILLQILDDGRLTDNKGHVISFKNTVVICTSNIGSRTIQQALMKQGKEHIEEAPTLSSYAISPKGRQLISIGNRFFIKETKDGQWTETPLLEYFSGQRIIEVGADGKEQEGTAPTFHIGTHAISPKGNEIITDGEVIYERSATTAKEWKKGTLVDYFKNMVVVNALPDMPDEQLPTAKLYTHTFSPAEVEYVSYKDRIWTRQSNKTEWETKTILEYIGDAKTEDGHVIPTTYWDNHIFTDNTEVIIVGNEVFQKSEGGKWKFMPLGDFFGPQFPLEAEIKKTQEVEDEVATKQFAQLKPRIQDELMKFMRPELVNRFDEVIIFEPLKYSHMLQIVKLQLKSLSKLMEEQSFGLHVTDAAQRELVKRGFDPVFGARPLRRTIQKDVENHISEMIISEEVHEGDVIVVDFDGETLVFTVDSSGAYVTTKEEKVSFTCKKCNTQFETYTTKDSTVVCAKCGSGNVEQTKEVQEKEQEQTQSVTPAETPEKKEEEVQAPVVQGTGSNPPL